MHRLGASRASSHKIRLIKLFINLGAYFRAICVSSPLLRRFFYKYIRNIVGSSRGILFSIFCSYLLKSFQHELLLLEFSLNKS